MVLGSMTVESRSLDRAPCNGRINLFKFVLSMMPPLEAVANIFVWSNLILHSQNASFGLEIERCSPIRCSQAFLPHKRRILAILCPGGEVRVYVGMAENI
jgi:hypothetical protein